MEHKINYNKGGTVLNSRKIMALQLIKITKFYQFGKNKQTVLNNLTIKFPSKGLIAIVGKSVPTIAKMAGICVPEGTRVLISRQTQIGPDRPYSREKLCPVLAFFTGEGWEECCRKGAACMRQAAPSRKAGFSYQPKAL